MTSNWSRKLETCRSARKWRQVQKAMNRRTKNQHVQELEHAIHRATAKSTENSRYTTLAINLRNDLRELHASKELSIRSYSTH